MKDVVFDVDGTLWDSSESILKAWNGVFAKRGMAELCPADIHACMGLTRSEIGAKLFPTADESLRGEILGECFAAQKTVLEKEGGKLYPGVAAILPLLAEKGKLFIVSNCECGYIETLFAFCGIGKFFSGYLCTGMTGKGKGENLAILREKYALSDFVYVGDTHTDETACRQAGVPFVWAAYGFGRAKSPAAEIRSFRDLPAALARL